MAPCWLPLQSFISTRPASRDSEVFTLRFSVRESESDIGGTRARGRAPRRWRRRRRRERGESCRLKRCWPQRAGRSGRLRESGDGGGDEGRSASASSKPGGCAERNETCAALLPSSCWRPRARAQSPRAPPPLSPARRAGWQAPPPRRRGRWRLQARTGKGGGVPAGFPAARAAVPAPAGRVYWSDLGCGLLCAHPSPTPKVCPLLSSPPPTPPPPPPPAIQWWPRRARGTEGGAPGTLGARPGRCHQRKASGGAPEPRLCLGSSLGRPGAGARTGWVLGNARVQG